MTVNFGESVSKSCMGRVCAVGWSWLSGAVGSGLCGCGWFGAVRCGRSGLSGAVGSGLCGGCVGAQGWSVRGCACGWSGLRGGRFGAVRRTTSAALGSPRRDASPSPGPSRLLRDVPPRVAFTLRRRGTPRRPGPAAPRRHAGSPGWWPGDRARSDRACLVGRDGDGAGRGDQVGLALGSGPLEAAGRGAVVAPSAEGLGPVMSSTQGRQGIGSGLARSAVLLIRGDVVEVGGSGVSGAVESAWGAVPGLLPVRFPRPLAEPAVRLSPQRALHGCCRRAGYVAVAQGLGILFPASGTGVIGIVAGLNSSIPSC